METDQFKSIKKPTDILGKKGESLVVQYLLNEGFTILHQNYKKFYGEIDIIAQKNTLMCFVEVKTRSNKNFLSHTIITPTKQQKILLVAQSFISSQQNISDLVYRFDTAFIYLQGSDYTLEYIPNAFTTSSN